MNSRSIRHYKNLRYKIKLHFLALLLSKSLISLKTTSVFLSDYSTSVNLICERKMLSPTKKYMLSIFRFTRNWCSKRHHIFKLDLIVFSHSVFRTSYITITAFRLSLSTLNFEKCTVHQRDTFIWLK